MAIHFGGEVTIDNYEFYGEFDNDSLAKALRREDGSALPKSKSGAAAAGDGGDASKGAKKRIDDQGPKKIIVRQLGGAYLLARFTAVAWSVWYGKHGKKLEPWSTFQREELNPQLRRLFTTPRLFDNNWQVSYRLMKCGEQYRVVRGGHEGFTPPLLLDRMPATANLTLAVGNNSVNLFVVNERSPGDRSSSIAMKEVKKDDWIVLKFVGPAAKFSDRAAAGHPSPLAELLKRHGDKTVGICAANDLRKAGAPISRALSWERTVSDVIAGIEAGSFLAGMLPRHLIITFDYDAALYLKIDPRHGAGGPTIADGSLVFSIEGAEGDFAKNIDGEMPGNETAFVSAFAALFYNQLLVGAPDPFTDVTRMLACALIAKRRLLQSGIATIGDMPFALVPMRKDEAPMPVIFYSEGIFSLNFSSPRREPPFDPYITADGRRKKERYFKFPGVKRSDDSKDPLSLADSDFAPNLAEHKITSYRTRRDCAKKENWSIFKEVVRPQTATADTGKAKATAANASPRTLSQFSDYVIDGKEPEGVPLGSFGKIKTADVGEIEAFRAVRALLQSYLSNPSTNTPLGIAVFGPPGAGKGFAVKNIAETLPDKLKDLIKEDRHECNLTALSDPEDLAHYFQLSRNGALRGKVPLLFFDEFDCSVERTRFYWLKHFLAPLQDGKFRSGHNVHPIGRAIFIFAGGVYTTFKGFSEAMEENRKLTQPKNQETVAGAKRATGARTYNRQGETQQNFKGVDFLSRLHGHIDVKAFSPRDAKDPETTRDGLFRCNGHDIVADPCFLMRRAFVLRSLLEMHLQKVFTQGSSKKARINRKVVNALLATKEFNHGARSMEAIIRMSFLENAESFEIAHLPPDDQLRMHVDGDNFKYCLDNDVDALWSEAGSRQASGKSRRPGNGLFAQRPQKDRIVRPDRRAAAAPVEHRR